MEKHIPNSMQVMPKDHTSTLPSYCPSSMAKMTSGAIQYGVPTKLKNEKKMNANSKAFFNRIDRVPVCRTSNTGRPEIC